MIAAFLMMPLWYQYASIAAFGLIIGSFLNVLLYRFHTGRSLGGSSHCLSCGEPLRWYELLPLFSYVALRGRCRSCGCYIPVRYFLVEAASAILFCLFYSAFGLSLLLVPSLLIAVVLLLITVYDLYHMIIPDELVIVLSVLAVLLFGVGYYQFFHWQILLYHSLAAIGAAGFYGSLWAISRGRWIGFGDVKLALPLGFMLGPWGAFSFVVLSFWIGAVISICILLIPRLRFLCSLAATAILNLWRTCPQGSVVNYRRYFTMKSEVPFAPFMVIAFLSVLLYDLDVLWLMMALL